VPFLHQTLLCDRRLRYMQSSTSRCHPSMRCSSLARVKWSASSRSTAGLGMNIQQQLSRRSSSRLRSPLAAQLPGILERTSRPFWVVGTCHDQKEISRISFLRSFWCGHFWKRSPGLRFSGALGSSVCFNESRNKPLHTTCETDAREGF
jgi:hypothetical protein